MTGRYLYAPGTSARARAQLYTVGVACIVSISSIERAIASALKLLHKRSFILALGIAGTGHTHNQLEENLNGHGRRGRCGSYGPVLYIACIAQLRGISVRLYAILCIKF